MRSKRQFSDVIFGNHLTQLDECWPTYLLRHFMEPWYFRKQTHGWETKKNIKGLIAAVDENMQRFTHTISVRLSAIYDIWKRRYDSHLMQLFVGFQQANLAKLRLRITSLPGIACQSRTWPMDMVRPSSLCFLLGHWESFKPTGHKKITGQRQGDPYTIHQ